ncbi:sigma-70 family RNA polymerase sigma factor [Cellulomonas oligotrophica]|uniref:RNA polymerase sigma factor (Sigma-70 family) n=2 Tax=Cellulomonas oligotrophica TaxID=931536 RepID=A0A7Y9FFX7_9CELL|nr:sigma-70 family RNA polymerase sigma factor [Cellulomonas oligotrophica]NYD86167.1 RNA polymerase sigma factor (sigma-70 family) [Cellulomonas oligotrophica]GIG34321.1 hypothetical protein Col01nite_34800 [Cellulomonas oligotrophica]
MVQTRGVDGVIEDDAALLHATREGDAEAYGRLYERHAGAALVVARQYVDSAADAEDVVHEAFANVHRALLGGGGPEVAFRAYLFTAVRRTATVHRTAGRRAEPTDDLATLEAGAGAVEAAEEPALETFERGIVARAFRSLPERWQAVLWHSEVEGLTPAQIGPILGLSANSTAALAYRAREGLRQAYLQHHLQDPLDEGCRAVSGRLGAHVRGGLGARDTAQVEAHLDGCGECRALVLELGDVNHGMRAVVAPLVLGLAGLGALAHELPVGGGLAAGAASLGAGGQGAAGGGAGASGGAGGGAAAGTAAAPAGAGAAGGAAGLAVAGSAGTTAGGLGALLAGMSGTAVAVAAGAVAVVAAAVVAAVNLLGGDPGPVAATPTVEVSGSTAAATLAPTPAGTPSSTPSATPTPTPTPTAIPDEPADEGTGAPVVDVGPAPTPTPEPTVDPTPDPEPPTPPALPELTVVAPDAGIALSAGTEQDLVVSIANTGGGVALDLTAEVDLPDGVTFVDVTTGFRVVGTFAPPVVPGWVCLQSGASASARCSLDELPARTTTQLVLRVSIDEGYAQEQSGALSVRVRGAGLQTAPWALPVHVERTGPRLVLVDADRTVDLVAGHPRAMSVEVRNAGGTSTGAGSATRGAGVDLALPAGADAVATSRGWSCARTSETGATCWHADGLAPGARSTLTLDVSGDDEATAGAGTFGVELRPARGVPSRFGVQYTVARPAAVVVTAPGDARLAAGVLTEIPVQVTNDGDLAARDVEVRVEPPAGFTWAGAVGAPAGWACSAAEGAEPVTCTVPTLDPGPEPVTLTLPATVPTATGPALGELWVRATASHARGHEHLGPSQASTTLTAALPSLTVEDLTVLSVQGSRDATVAFAVTAPAARGGTDPRPVVTGATAQVTLPAGVRLDPYPDSPVVGGCAATQDPRTVRCDLGDLVVGDDGAKAVAGASFAVEAGGALSGTVRVTASAPGAPDATATAAVRFGSAGLLPVFAGQGDLEVTEIGAPLLTCRQRSTAPCAAVRDGSQDNNALEMVALDELAPSTAGVPGPRASVPVSSGATLVVPKGRDVVWARLYWSAVRAPGDTWSTSTGTARLRTPDGEWSDVEARERTTTVRDKDGREYYQSAADVTELVRGGGGGEWGVADVAVAATRTDEVPTYYGGWALVVVHGTLAEPADGAPAASSAVTVYDGGTWVGSGAATAPEFSFVAEPGSQARVGVVAWEGDRGGSGDRATLGSTTLVPQRWGGTGFVGGGSAQNAFDSTATGSRYLHSLGVDAKGFQPAALSATGVSTLRLTTTSDQYLVGAVTLRTVPRDGTTVPDP